MGQKLRPDYIPQLIKTSATQVKLPATSLVPAYCTLGGQQYRITSDLLCNLTMSANTRYQLYLVLSSGSPILVQSANENSVGPAGYSLWQLVGSFYADGTASPVFGSFVNIDGVPSTISIPATFTWTNAAALNGQVMFWDRYGELVHLHGQTNFGTGGTGTYYLNLPFSINTSKLETEGKAGVGHANGSWFYDNVAGYPIALSTQVYSATQLTFCKHGATSLLASTANNDRIGPNIWLPVSGWSNTPIRLL